jgi:RND family efflux transporter MFP subunit
MSRNRGIFFFALLGAVVILSVAWGLFGRQNTLASLRVTADQTAVPPVQIVYPQHGDATRAVDLPGNIVAWYQAPIYAQVSGYVKMWYADYGAEVKRGEVLATIDAPELDAQYQAAQAQLAVAQTRYNIAALTAKRYSALSGTQAVSQQEVDVEVADAAAQQAQVKAAQDDVARYAALEAFKRVVAPFDGVVTSRSTDVGDYVSAGGGDLGSSGTSSELFSVADIHKMRVFVAVPQDYADALQKGLTATLQLPQFPHQTFTAHFLTTAGAFDPQSRTVTTELVVENPGHTIWPGSYADVHLVVKADSQLLVIPEQALLFRAQGLQVAVVEPNNLVHLQDVTLGLNLGSTVQVESGLNPSDRVIDNPSDGLLEGEAVNIVPGEQAVALPADDTHLAAIRGRTNQAAEN